jgi:hypothetical protein
MILLTLLYLTFACALPTPSDIPTDIPSSVFTHGDDIFGTRSIWHIIWSCFTTIFTCTWIAVHPNIPGPKDSPWAVLRRHVAIMGYVIIAPEMVILWATRQHYAARHLAKQYQERGWTMTHGFFLVMGGFTLHDPRGTPLRILVPRELETLSKAGKVTWPSITEEEIQDRCKGDYLSKAFVLVQTSWFITQCIVRGVYGLAVTELEVATLTFAALSGVTYYLWWHKPIDVRCSVPVYLLLEANENKEVGRRECVLSTSGSPAPDPPSIPRPISRENIVAPDPEPNPREPSTSNSILAPPHNATTISGSDFTQMQRFSAFIQQQQQKHGTLLGLAYVFIIHPPFSFFRGFRDMRSSDTVHDSSPLRVPTFYAPDSVTIDDAHIGVAYFVAIVFGGIHCIAWSFQFPSVLEWLAWRISAASMCGVPIFLAASLHFISEILKMNPVPAIVAFRIIYVITRIILLILPCIQLRALPASAFVDIQWTSFFPHVG